MRVIGLAVVLAVSTFLAPLAAWAQQAEKVYRVGYLSPYSADYVKTYRTAFQRGLRDLGYVEGQNLVIEERHVKGRLERYPELAAELVGLKIDVFVLHGGTPELFRAAEQASSTIPILFVANPDPVGFGLVASLARPGGRATGLSDFHSGLLAKRLELLKEAVPSVTRVAVLHSTTSVSLSGLRGTQAVASALRLTVVPVEIRRAPEPDDIDSVFGAPGVHVSKVADLAIKNRIPTIGTVRMFTENGYLMSYGASFSDLYRRAATYVDKILKGAKPADLPVEQPTKFELVINLKTAKALGLTIPQSLAVRADEVIQ